MADPLGLVAISVLIGASFILLKHRRDFRLTRILIVIASSLLFVISLTHSALGMAVAALILGSELALLPVATYDLEDQQKVLFKTIITYQLCSHILLIFAFLPRSGGHESALTEIFLAATVLLRLVMPFLSRTFNQICITVAPWSRSLFFLSTSIFAILVCSKFQFSLALVMLLPFAVSIANSYFAESNRERFLFVAQALVCLPFFLEPILTEYARDIGFALCVVGTVALSQMTLSSQRVSSASRKAPRWLAITNNLDVNSYLGFDYLCTRASFICRHFFGPIVVEWLVIRIPALLMSLLRIISRSASYAGLPKLVLTSILVSIFMLIYILKV